MSSRYEIHIAGPGEGGGPPPPTEIDYFAPKYLVGNVPAGDSAVAHSAGGFIYIPDPGDGTGIQTALVQADGPGDVWLRPGTYDFQAGAVSGALSIPGVRVLGSGFDTTIIRTRSDGDQGAFILLAGASLEDCTVISPANAGAPGTQRGLLSVPSDGCSLRRLGLASTPDGNSALRSLISLAAGGGGTVRTTTIEDVTYSVGGNVTTGDPTSALEVVPGFGAVIANVTTVKGTGGDKAFYDPSAVGNGISQLIAERLTLSDWKFGAIRWNGVGVINTLKVDSSAPDVTAVCVAIASRPQVPSTVLRDVWLDPKGTVQVGISLLADVNGNVGQAPEIYGVTWSGNAAVSSALLFVAAAAARGGKISKIYGVNNISSVGLLLKGLNPDWSIDGCTIEMLGTSGRTGIESDSVRTKIIGNTVSLLASGSGGVGTAIKLLAAEPVVNGNTIVAANAADVGIDGTTANANGNVVGNILDMATDANAFVNMAASCNQQANVVV